jgi:heterotetrameric sarcosine oxidase alpha subunit
MSQSHRIPGRGAIDRTRPVRFSFDGRDYKGFHGDTLASALLANGVRLMARSFKYHRPRGPLTAGSEEPNALVEVLEDGQQTPNVRATVQEIYSGLRARSQNRWPSLAFDALAANDRFSGFLSAGFYYKTFMWPRGFWEKVYEPAIRRAAGLGSLSGRHDEGRYEKAWAHCDLLVIGSGPAGLMAALVAGRAGADVILAEEDRAMGGRLLSEAPEIEGQPGDLWARGVLAELAAMPNVRLMPRTTVTGAYDDGTYAALERVGLHLAAPAHLPRECFWRIVAKRTILAAGALERPIAHPDNDRPGVMLASAARAYVRRWGVDPGRVIVFGNNDSALASARALTAAGVRVLAYVDPRPVAPVEEFRVYRGEVVGTSGRRGLKTVRIRHKGGVSETAADTLALAGGWNPTLHLACHMNARPNWDETIAAFVPRDGMVPGMSVAGAAAGRFSTGACLADGVKAAQEVLDDLDLMRTDLAIPKAEDGTYAIAPLWRVDAPGRAWLDFANDVTTKDVALAAQEGFLSVEHMKRYTTQGMAPDQGKSSNVAALAVLADATGQGIAATGTTTFRPPFVPVSIAAMGAGARGKGFAPERRATSDVAARRMGAPMIEAGLWYRPSYFPRAGEATWREACDREVRMVREAVGVCDVSTLGKIDVQGDDTEVFLDFVYTNSMSSLKPGRVRYGLMLREDGHVMDDGTCARLSDRQFLITTTTAAAGQVMRHLDFVHQAFRADRDVRLISVTEHWAQFALAGPKARELLNIVLQRLKRRRIFRSWPAGRCISSACRGACSASRSRANWATNWRCPRDTARRCSSGWWRRPRSWAAALRDGGAERAQDREGLHHPCRDPRPDYSFRHRDGADGLGKEGLHRQDSEPAAGADWTGARATGRPDAARRAGGADRWRASLPAGGADERGAGRGLRHLGRLLADTVELAGAGLSAQRPGAARADDPRR